MPPEMILVAPVLVAIALACWWFIRDRRRKKRQSSERVLTFGYGDPDCGYDLSKFPDVYPRDDKSMETCRSRFDDGGVYRKRPVLVEREGGKEGVIPYPTSARDAQLQEEARRRREIEDGLSMVLPLAVIEASDHCHLATSHDGTPDHSSHTIHDHGASHDHGSSFDGGSFDSGSNGGEF